MELTADRLVIIGRGRLLLDTTIGELITTEGFTTLEDAYLSLTDEWTVHRAGGERR
jgi:ABC-2 type transport system ATP-binding protein